MSKKIVLSTTRSLGRVALKNQRKIDREIRQAMVRSAEFSVSAVQRTIRKVEPYKPIATGTYTKSWAYKKTRWGAVVGSNAYSAIFVEAGRPAGKQPPIQPIYDWVLVKRLAQKELRRRKAKETAADSGDTKPDKKTAADKEKEKAKKDATSTGAGDDAPKEKKKRKKRGPSKRVRKVALAIAWAVARKIAKKGTPQKRVMFRTLPKIQKRVKREVNKGIKRGIGKASGSP